MTKFMRSLFVSISVSISMFHVGSIAFCQSVNGSQAVAQTKVAPAAANAATVIPALIRYSGASTYKAPGTRSGDASVTFLIFKDEKGGEPLWTETQMVPFDDAGRYDVYLGAADGAGLPTDLFSSGEARWLEVQVAGAPQEPRALLTSVPYALKAADAATLGGLPVSAFALAGSVNTATQSGLKASPDANSDAVTTPGGVAGHLPVFSGSATIGDSIVFQSATSIGINTTTPAATLDVNGSMAARGAVTLHSIASAVAAGGKNSQPLNFLSSVYNSSTKAAAYPEFTLQAEPSANDTSAPSGTLNLLFGNGATPAETGLSISSKGILKFASGQTFPGGSGTGTITGVTAGTGLLGGGTTGTVKLSLDPKAVPTLTGSPTFSGGTGNGLVGNTSGTYLDTAGVQGAAGSRSGYNGVAGVWGDSYNADGVYGTSYVQAGVEGTSHSGPGLRGNSTTGNGVLGTTAGNTLGTAGVFGVAGARTSFGGIAAVWGDADAHVGVFGSSNQYSGVYGASTSSNGVLGTTVGNAANTAGVLGVNGSRTSFSGIAGVWGDSATQAGVLGSSTTYTGVFGNSVSGSGVYGASGTGSGGQFTSGGNASTVSASNTYAFGGVAVGAASSGAYGYGVYANATGSNGTGVLGTGNLNGVYGSTTGNILNTAGALGVAGARTGFAGIAGVWGDAQEHIGVIGSSKDYEGVLGTSNGVGVHGIGGSSTYPSIPSVGGYIGVWGDITGDAGLDIGYAVVGSANNTDSGYFTNNSDYYPTVLATNYGGGDGFSTNPAVATLQHSNRKIKTMELSTPGGTCSFGGDGDMACTGAVKSLATTQGGAKTVETYSMQSPENWMEDFGSGSIQNGVGKVTLDPDFADTITTGADYHVFLTPRGDSRGIYVTNVTATGFEVHESAGGISSLGFDYRIVAKRRGYESKRMVDVTEETAASRERFVKSKPILKHAGSKE